MAKRWRITLSIVACACGGASERVDAPPVDPPVVNPAAFVSVTGPLQRFGRVDGLYYECAYEWTARVTGDPGGVLYWAGVEVEVTTKRGKDQSTAGPEFLTSVFGRDHLSVGDSARGVARIAALQVLYDAPDPVPHVARVGIRYTQKPPGQTAARVLSPWSHPTASNRRRARWPSRSSTLRRGADLRPTYAGEPRVLARDRWEACFPTLRASCATQ